MSKIYSKIPRARLVISRIPQSRGKTDHHNAMNHRIISLCLLFSAALGVRLAAAEASAPGRNYVRNASFEQGDGNRPRSWREERYAGRATLTYANAGRTGNRSVMISSEEGADVSWSANVIVEPFARYRLSGWIKTENVAAPGARGALLNVHSLSSAATEAVTGTADWKEVSVEFDVEDQDSLQINCLFGGWGSATGKAWFDDVRLEQIGTREVPSPSVTIQADEIGAPMSENIYSQFIEHLGRCIYGGIWAEMLEDRKFYYPVTETYNPYRSLRNTPYPVVGASPWEPLGSAGSVTMTTNRPFVGRHTPRLAAEAGLRQHDLGVVDGKRYVGYLWAKADGPAAAAEVSLSWGEGNPNRQVKRLASLGGEYQRHAFEFTAGATTDKAQLEIRAREGAVLLGTISLMPADNVEGMRADTLQLLRELNAPIYRWPGGNFVSGYDWRDGVGPRDRRPPRTNPAWTGVEHNDFGMHEFVRFCELVKSKPWITVNTGFGDAYSAAAQLEYCNGSADTHYGRQRAGNGAPQPFNVRYWGVGNEMWGTWQLGFMRLEHYVLKQNWVVDKMREIDPSIITISSGNIGPWSTGLLKGCADHMDFIAEHFYCQEQAGLRAHVRQIPNEIRRKAEFHRTARRDLTELKGKDIRIAMTEWNYWYGPHLFGELGTRYFLKDGLGIAAGLHEFARQSDLIDSAFYAQTVNVIGCIKTSRTSAAFETTGLVLKLYRHHFGQLPVSTTTTGLIDAQAAWTANRKKLTISIVNPTRAAADVPLELAGASLRGTGTRWEIAGDDPMAYNDPGQPPRVVIHEQKLTDIDHRLSVAPCSVTLFSLDTAE